MSFRTSPVGRRLAGLFTALLVGAMALPPALHADMDDLACQFGAASTRTNVDADDSASGALHCEVCHWLRSIRVFDVAQVDAHLAVATVATVDAPPASRPSASSLVVRASRAPPLA